MSQGRDGAVATTKDNRWSEESDRQDARIRARAARALVKLNERQGKPSPQSLKDTAAQAG